MREMAHGDLLLDFDVGEEGALVVNAERKDAVLIWGRERSAIDGAIGRAAARLQRQSVPWGEHGEF